MDQASRTTTRAAWLTWVGVLAGLAWACSEPAADAGDSATADDAVLADGDADSAQPDDTWAATCPPAATWQPGQAAFVEVTKAWGLEGVQGSRMNVIDLEGDGRPDLIVRQGGGPNFFAADGPRSTWVLRNTGSGFEDVTQASGLLQRRVGPQPDQGEGATVWAAGDVDNDGDIDVFLGRGKGNPGDPGETSEILLNDGKGAFVLGPPNSAARFADQPSVPMSASFVDFDKDGLLDLWVVHNMPGGAQEPLQDRLLRGDGAGGFTDVTLERGLETLPWQSVPLLNQGRGHSWAWSATACDLNNDGLEELLAASYGRAPNHLWRATRDAAGNVAYVDESVASGYAFDERQDWSDNKSAQCFCADSPSATDCAGVPKPDPQLCASLAKAFGPSYRWNHASDRQPWRLGGNSGTTVCADVNNDGWLDLLTTEIVHWDVGSSSDPSELLFNIGSGDVRLQRVGNEVTGLVRQDASPYWDHGDISAAVYDFDNDGWLDVHLAASDYPANRALLFRQTAPMQFQEVAPEDFFLRMRAAGVAAADFDGDGDLDVLTGHTRMRCSGDMGSDCQPDDQIHLHRNEVGGRFVQLELVGGPGSNRMAIGARVEIDAAGVRQTSLVDGGHGQSSAQRDRVLHFGLGTACQAQVRIVWPDAEQSEQTFAVDAGTRLRVVQGQPPVRAD